MCRRAFIALIMITAAACGGSPNDEPKPAEPPQDTALLDAAQAPLQRAEGVQQTLDASAAKEEADAAAQMEGQVDTPDDPDPDDDEEEQRR